MYDSCDMKDLVIQGIQYLRIKKRKRPTIKDLYFYCQEFDESNILDFNAFHDFIQHMLDSEIIINRNKHEETKESFHVNKNYAESVNKTNFSFM